MNINAAGGGGNRRLIEVAADVDGAVTLETQPSLIAGNRAPRTRRDVASDVEGGAGAVVNEPNLVPPDCAALSIAHDDVRGDDLVVGNRRLDFDKSVVLRVIISLREIEGIHAGNANRVGRGRSGIESDASADGRTAKINRRIPVARAIERGDVATHCAGNRVAHPILGRVPKCVCLTIPRIALRACGRKPAHQNRENQCHDHRLSHQACSH